jgi:hypothetical protein
LQAAFDALYPKGQQWYWRADFVNTIPDAAVDIHQRFGSALPTLPSTMHLYPINGAAHDVASTDTAWAYRDATWGSVFAGVGPEPADADAVRRWSIDYFGALHPYSAGGAYVNMMMDEGERASACQLSRQLSPAGRDKGGVRPREPVPSQPKHPASWLGRNCDEGRRAGVAVDDGDSFLCGVTAGGASDHVDRNTDIQTP